MRRRDLPAAETAFKRYLDLAGQALGEGSPEFAAKLDAVALTYEQFRHAEKADGFRIRAKEVRRALWGESDRLYIDELVNTAKT